MANTKTLHDLKAGDKVAHYCGWGSVPPKEAKVKKTTKNYVILEDYFDEKFRKEDGSIVGDCLRGKTDRIAIPTPEMEAQWSRESLVESFMELMNNRSNYNAAAFRKAVHQLTADYLDQDDYISVITALLKCQSISSETLENAINELWDKIC